MSKAYRRWRRGTVERVSANKNNPLQVPEWRVGSVPPEDGFLGTQATRLGKGVYGPAKRVNVYIKPSSMAIPDFQDLYNAMSKITTRMVRISCYVVRPSGNGHTFRWVSGKSMLTSDVRGQLQRIIHGMLPVTSTTEYGIRLLPIDYNPPYIVAWNFMEA